MLNHRMKNITRNNTLATLPVIEFLLWKRYTMVCKMKQLTTFRHAWNQKMMKSIIKDEPHATAIHIK
jgi:hypothetical protein